MDDAGLTREQLMCQLQQLRQRVAALETAVGDQTNHASLCASPDASTDTSTIDVVTKYELLAAVTPDVILFIRARDGRILEANRAAEETYGYSRAELLNLTIYDLRAPATRSLVKTQMSLAETQNLIFETVHQHRDGREFPVEVNSGSIMLDGERILLSIVRDITTRRQAEEYLRQSEERFSKSFFNAPVALILTRLSNGRIFEVNDHFLKLFEYSRVDVIGHTGAELGIYVQPGEPAEILKEIAAQGLVREREVTGRTRSGALRQALLSAVPVKLNGEDCLLIMSIDITERKQMEAALHELNATLEEQVQARTAELQIAAHRVLELDRLKDDFISRINHELRTPLTNVKIYAELLEHGRPEKHMEYFHMFRQQAARLQQLIEDLLKINQLASELIELEPASINVNQLLEEHLAGWLEQAMQHGLELTVDLKPDLPPALVDPELIAQVIAQLVHNAVSYTAQGQITLSTALQPREQQWWVTVSVADTGPGIAPDELPHIFERFYRGRAAADYKTPGTGVGLAISRNIVTRLHGIITVESEVDRGSIFTLWLPLASA